MQLSQNLNQSMLRYRGHIYPLNKPQIIIGSGPNCDILIENNPSVLPMHVQIISYGEQVALQCLEQNAATWINGTPVFQQVLQDQDKIFLGDQNTQLIFELKRSPAGVDQTMILPPRSQPITDRHASQQAPSASQSAYSADASASQARIRQAPFNPPEQQASASNPSASQHQIDFPTQQPAYQSAIHAQHAAVQGPGGATAGLLGLTQGAARPPQTPQVQAYAYPQASSLSASNAIATNTTRYLCAAGHLDEDFQDYVLCHVIHEERRALGETYGVDMLAVVSWCKAGLRRINTRDALLGIVFLIICCIIAFQILQESLSVIRQLSQMAQYYAQSGNGGYTPTFQEILFLLTSSGLLQALGLLILLWIVRGIENWIKRNWPKSHPGFVSLVILAWLFGFYVPIGVNLLLVFALWLIIFVELIFRFYGDPTNLLRKGAFNPQYRPVELDPALESKLIENFTTAQRNVIAYSGYRPFAGAGSYQGGWSFAIDTSKGTPDPSTPGARLTPQSMTISNLYEQIEKDVRALNINDVLEIEGKLYVNGQFLAEHPPFFNAAQLRPMTSVDPRLVEQYKEHPIEDIRYYQCLRFNFWRGEMIFTAFVRFIQRGKDLFTEVDYLLLPPMKEVYYWVDRKQITPTAGMVWSLFKSSFDEPVKLWFGVPFRLLRTIIYTAEQQKLARVALNSPAFDYGAATSLRWEASDSSYHLFFQKLDEEMYLKIVEMQILETIIAFLDAHQIDTAELRERQQTILNNNTYVNGQNVNIGAMATGWRGHASNTNQQAPYNTTPAPAGNSGQAKSRP